MNSSKQVVGETRAGLIYGVFDFYAMQHVQPPSSKIRDPNVILADDARGLYFPLDRIGKMVFQDRKC